MSRRSTGDPPGRVGGTDPRPFLHATSYLTHARRENRGKRARRPRLGWRASLWGCSITAAALPGCSPPPSLGNSAPSPPTCQV